MNLLVAVDGSDASLRVIHHIIAKGSLYANSHIHLLNVQQALPGHVGRLVHPDDLDDYHRAEATKCLAPARSALDGAGIPYTHHIGVGEPGEVVVQFAIELSCEQILMGIHNCGVVAEFFMGSVSKRVIELTKIPVLLVP